MKRIPAAGHHPQQKGECDCYLRYVVVKESTVYTLDVQYTVPIHSSNTVDACLVFICVLACVRVHC